MAGRRSVFLGALALAITACSSSDSARPPGTETTAASEASAGSFIAVTNGSAPDTVATTASTGSVDATGPDKSATAGASASSSEPVETDLATSAPSAPSAAGTSDTAAATTSTTVAPTTTVPATTTTVAGQPPVVEAAAYTVFDMRSNRYLAQSEADVQRPVGSLMKMLTAHVSYQAGAPTRVVVAPDGLLLSDDESSIDIQPAQELSRDLLIRAMLKASANDAARLLAIDIAGSEAAFAEQMNAAAAALGMTNTRAANATGLDADGQYSSANDMTNLGVMLMGNISFQLAVKDPTAELNGQAYPNTNALIGVYPGADGIKTGHTTGAGWCVTASAIRENRRIVVTVLGAPTEEARDAAATALLDWGFAQP